MNSNPDQEVERRLFELAKATENIAPTSGFQARVMFAIRAEDSNSFGRELVRSTRRGLPLAAVTVVLAVGWAALNERATTAALAAVDDSQETLESAW